MPSLSRMPGKRRPTDANDHLNRDGYIWLNVLSGRFGADIERICAAHDLTEAHYRVLWVLCLSPSRAPLAMGDIVDGVINKASDMTRLVDKLERLGHVVRSASTVDKRRVLVKATPGGRRVFRAITSEVKKVHYSQWAGLDADELRTLVGLLKKAMRGAE